MSSSSRTMCAWASACDAMRLEVLAAGGERDREALLDVRHGLGHRPSRHADRAPDHERVEVRVDVRLVLLQLERAVDELLRAIRVAGLAEDRVAERGQRQRLHQAVSLGLCLGANLLHLDAKRQSGRRASTRRAQRSSGAGASARARPPAGAACAPTCTARGPGRASRRPSAPRPPRSSARRAERRRARRGACAAWSRWCARISSSSSPGTLLDPLREPRVLLGARLLGEPRVRDLADEHVLEAVRRLARDRGTRLAEDELAQQQVFEQRARRRDRAPGARAPPTRTRGRRRRRAGAAPCRRARGGRCARR